MSNRWTKEVSESDVIVIVVRAARGGDSDLRGILTAISENKYCNFHIVRKREIHSLLSRSPVIIVGYTCPLDDVNAEGLTTDRRHLVPLETLARHFRMPYFELSSSSTEGYFSLLCTIVFTIMSSFRFQVNDQCALVTSAEDDIFDVDTSPTLAKSIAATNLRKLYVICMSYYDDFLFFFF